MPNKWGLHRTIEDRMAQLSEKDRRCDANSQHCTRGAVEEYRLKAADGNFIALPDAEVETKKSCSLHRKQFAHNGRWVVLGVRRLAATDSHSRRNVA